MKIQIIGVQASGKSTIAKLLAKKLNYKYYSFSDLIKNAINNQDAYVTAQYSMQDIKNGMLAPDNVIQYLLDSIEEENFVMEGYIRTPGQAQSFVDAAEEEDIVIELRITKELALDRMKKRAREDDTDITIENRLNKFYANEKKINVILIDGALARKMNFQIHDSSHNPDALIDTIMQQNDLN